MTGDVHVQLGDAATAEQLFERICELYDEAFSVPPHHWEPDESNQHRRRLTTLLADPSFGITVLHAGDDLIGFCYGYQLAVPTTRWERFLEPLPEDVTNEWPGRTFFVMDLVVQAPFRGHGYGRQLLATLLSSRREERATLSVQPQVEENHGFYQHLGWQLVGRRRGKPGDASPFFDAYLLPLRADDTSERVSSSE